MTLSASRSTRPGAEVHWIVRMNHRNRSGSFVAIFAILGSHLWFTGAGLLPWLMLALNFLIWPQLAYLRARQARNSMSAELNNLIGDAVMFGVWCAALGYPSWITFILSISICMNLVVFRGVSGFLQACAGLVAGAGLGTLLAGPSFTPETHWLTNLLGAFSIFGYFMLIGLIAYHRSQVLHRAREEQRIIAQELKKQIEENSLLQQQLREQANRDPLTGLYNRRHLEDCLPREIARCQREGTPLSLILIDIDRFKSVNDRFGHGLGDRVICALAEYLMESCRGSDIACRFGGEEFLLLLPGMGSEAARARAEVLRQKFNQHPMEEAPAGLVLSLSAGVATRQEPVSPELLIQIADEALYQAKESGRNRVVTAGHSGGETVTRG